MSDIKAILVRLKDHVSRVCEAYPDDADVIFPCVSPAALDEAESRMGLRLPELLRRIYLEVGNGGLAIGPGINGLPGGYACADRDVVTDYRERVDYGDDYWPKGVVPFCDWGCCMTSCVECDTGRVYHFDGNGHGEGDRFPDADSWRLEARTLEQWFQAKLDE